MQHLTPMGALVRGLVAGAAGSLVQGLYFKYTARLSPETPKGVFQPPEREQHSEPATATVARRFVSHLMQRGPLSEEEKQLGANIVHFSFGSLWGGLYGLVRESLPASLPVHRPGVELALGLGYGTVVWAVSDNVILPAFRLSADMRSYPLANHAYAIAAHLVYGATVYATYSVLRMSPWAAAIAWVASGQARKWMRRQTKMARASGKTLRRIAIREPSRPNRIERVVRSIAAM